MDDRVPDDMRYITVDSIIETHTDVRQSYEDSSGINKLIEEFHRQTTVRGGLDVYIEMVRVIMRQRNEANSRITTAKDRMIFLRNISGESESLICSSNGFVDKTELVRGVSSGEIAYPYFDHQKMPQQEFLGWLKIAAYLDRIILVIYSLEGSIGALLKKQIPLSESDYECVHEKIAELSEIGHWLNGIMQHLNFLPGDYHEGAVRNTALYADSFSQVSDALAQRKTEDLLIALEKMGLSLAGIESKLSFHLCASWVQPCPRNAVDRLGNR